jgi:holo-[acyl-carrier protein] synthase
MIIGIGIDHVEVATFKKNLAAGEADFLDRVFTQTEVRYAKSTDDYVERLAGRFAAKEAAFKALGTGWASSVDWKDIEITNIPSGQPVIRFTGRAAEIASATGAKRFLVSISHSRHLATAEVIIEA